MWKLLSEALRPAIKEGLGSMKVTPHKFCAKFCRICDHPPLVDAKGSEATSHITPPALRNYGVGVYGIGEESGNAGCE